MEQHVTWDCGMMGKAAGTRNDDQERTRKRTFDEMTFDKITFDKEGD